jgi:signal transduction histidine kinase
MHVSERALDESRGAIGALACAPGESLARVLASSVREVASRSGAVASVHVDDEVEPSVEVREAVLRVAREATSNAARHGRATRVVVTLEGGEALRLTVSDNGVGFDAQGARLAGCGFGLESMQERARAVGGTLSVRSRRGEGTEITATLPCDRPRLVLAR